MLNLFEIYFNNPLFSSYFEGKGIFLEAIMFGIFMTGTMTGTVTQKFAYNKDLARKRLRKPDFGQPEQKIVL
jgi:hypothetical protein